MPRLCRKANYNQNLYRLRNRLQHTLDNRPCKTECFKNLRTSDDMSTHQNIICSMSDMVDEINCTDKDSSDKIDDTGEDAIDNEINDDYFTGEKHVER